MKHKKVVAASSSVGAAMLTVLAGLMCRRVSGGRVVPTQPTKPFTGNKAAEREIIDAAAAKRARKAAKYRAEMSPHSRKPEQEL